MGWRAPVRWGWGWGGGRGFPRSWWSPGQSVHRTLCSTCPRPDADAATSEEHRAEDRPQSARGFTWGSCAILPRKWGEDAGASGDAPPPSPPRSAVTQPCCPRRLSWAPAAALSGPPPCIPPGSPLPGPTRRAGLRVPLSPVCQPTRTSAASRLCARSCSLRTGRGWGLGRTAPLHPTDPPPEVPFNRDVFDVTGL